MLEGLDKVDWKSIKNMFRTAERIPELLREILLPNTNQLHIFLQIESLICDYNGDPVPAMPMLPTLPFLFELLTYEEFTLKAYLLNFLGKVLMEGSEHLHMKTTNDFMRKCIDLIKSKESLYVQFLEDESLAIRFSAISVLSHLSVSNDTLRMVVFQANNDANRDLQVLTARYLVEFALAKDDSDTLFQEIVSMLYRKFSSETHPPYQALLAFGLLKLLKEKACEEAINILIESTEDRTRFDLPQQASWMKDHHLEYTYWDIGQSDYQIIALFYECGQEVGYPALFEIMKLRKDREFWRGQYLISGISHLKLCIAVLDLLFDKSYYSVTYPSCRDRKERYQVKFYRNREQMSEWDVLPIQITMAQQHEFLIWLVDIEPFWEKDHNLLVWYGLPASHDGLRKFLKKYSGTIE